MRALIFQVMNLTMLITIISFLLGVAGFFGIGYLLARLLENIFHINLFQ